MHERAAGATEYVIGATSYHIFYSRQVSAAAWTNLEVALKAVDLALVACLCGMEA